jgi:hypothetical protein
VRRSWMACRSSSDTLPLRSAGLASRLAAATAVLHRDIDTHATTVGYFAPCSGARELDTIPAIPDYDCSQSRCLPGLLKLYQIQCSVVVIVIIYPNLRGCLDGLLEYTRQMAVLRARARQISMITPMLSRGTVKSVVRNLWWPIRVRPGFAGGAADGPRTSRRASLRRRPRL